MSDEHRLLIVANELGDFISEVLEPLGYQVTIIRGSNIREPEGVQCIFRELKNGHEIIILTNNKVGPWYFEDVIPTIRELYPKMIIMVVSAYYSEELIQRWKTLGADDFLSIPFRIEVLSERLESLLSEE